MPTIGSDTPGSAPPARVVRGLGVLLVEDDPIVRLDVRRILERAGHRVVGEAGEGLRGAELAAELAPDLVLLDIGLPGLDGIAAARRIGERRRTPIVLLTGYRDLDAIRLAAASGVYGYVTKPFGTAELLGAVTVARARFEEHRALYAEAG